MNGLQHTVGKKPMLHSHPKSYMIRLMYFTENTHYREKYHCTAYLLFDRFGFDQTRKAVANST